jgi:hypothetical protein
VHIINDWLEALWKVLFIRDELAGMVITEKEKMFRGLAPRKRPAS